MNEYNEESINKKYFHLYLQKSVHKNKSLEYYVKQI